MKQMSNREKVIEGLKAMRDFLGIGLSSQTQVFEEDQKILEDAIAMLKDQETTDTNDLRVFHCKKCGYGVEDIFILDEHNYSPVPKFCPNCGRVVKLDA